MNGDVEFAGALIMLSCAVQCHYNDVSRRHDLTSQQAMLLCALLDGPTGMAQLTERLHIEKSTLTGLVDRAARRTLVRRVPDLEDRRAVRVEVTPEGHKLAEAFKAEMTSTLLTQMADLPRETHGQLRASLPQAALTLWASLA